MREDWSLPFPPRWVLALAGALADWFTITLPAWFARRRGRVVCAGCDEIGPDTWDEAIPLGWRHGTFGPDGDSCVLCPHCLKNQAESMPW